MPYRKKKEYGENSNMIKNDNFVQISGWMINELNLKGNELFIYSIIHGFSQDGKSDYHGGLSYLAEWTNSTKQGVIKNLKSLTEKGLIVKIDEKLQNNSHLCRYFTTKSRKNITINNRSELSLIGESEKDKQPAQDHSTKFNTVQKESGKQSLIDHSTLFNGGIKQSLPNKNSLKEFKNLSSENKDSVGQETQSQKTEKTKTERQTEISKTLKKLFGNTKLFTNDFVPNLSELCEKRQIPPEEYISWTYGTLQKKNLTNFTGYFFRTILSEPNVSKFLFEKTQQKEHDAESGEKKNAPKTKCKVCGAEHLLYGDCPVCGLMLNERDDPEKINFHRKMYLLPSEKKQAMNSELQEMRKKTPVSVWNAEKVKIYEKYGVI